MVLCQPVVEAKRDDAVNESRAPSRRQHLSPTLGGAVSGGVCGRVLFYWVDCACAQFEVSSLEMGWRRGIKASPRPFFVACSGHFWRKRRSEQFEWRIRLRCLLLCFLYSIVDYCSVRSSVRTSAALHRVRLSRANARNIGVAAASTMTRARLMRVGVAAAVTGVRASVRLTASCRI